MAEGFLKRLFSMVENKFTKFLKLDSLFESAKGYIDARFQLLKLEMQEKTANAMTTAIFIILIGFCSMMALMFLSIALGNYLNTILGTNYWGYCILGGFYLIVLILLAINISKGLLYRKVRNSIFKSISGRKPEN